MGTASKLGCASILGGVVLGGLVICGGFQQLDKMSRDRAARRASQPRGFLPLRVMDPDDLEKAAKDENLIESLDPPREVYDAPSVLGSRLSDRADLDRFKNAFILTVDGKRMTAGRLLSYVEDLGPGEKVGLTLWRPGDKGPQTHTEEATLVIEPVPGTVYLSYYTCLQRDGSFTSYVPKSAWLTPEQLRRRSDTDCNNLVAPCTPYSVSAWSDEPVVDTAVGRVTLDSVNESYAHTTAASCKRRVRELKREYPSGN